MPMTVPNRPRQRRRRGDRPKRRQEALELVRDALSRLFDRFLHHVARAAVIAQRSSEDRAERRILGEPGQDLRRRALALVDRDHLLEQRRRHDPARLQRDCALDDQRNGDDRGEQKRPDWPSSGWMIANKSGLRFAFRVGFCRGAKSGATLAKTRPRRYPQNLWTSLWIAVGNKCPSSLQRARTWVR
jgi:hypothetical protein